MRPLCQSNDLKLSLTVISAEILGVGRGVNGTTRPLGLTKRKNNTFDKHTSQMKTLRGLNRLWRLRTSSWTGQILRRTKTGTGQSRWAERWWSSQCRTDRLLKKTSARSVSRFRWKTKTSCTEQTRTNKIHMLLRARRPLQERLGATCDLLLLIFIKVSAHC